MCSNDRQPIHQVWRLDGQWVRFLPIDVAETTWMVVRGGICRTPPELLTTAQKNAMIRTTENSRSGRKPTPPDRSRRRR